GGLAKSVKKYGCIFDYGAHGYHSNKKEILKIFKQLAGNFTVREKNVKINFLGKYYKYPLEAFDLAKKLDPLLSFVCFLDFVIARVKRRVFKKKDDSMEDWIVNRFGRKIYDIYFGPYSTKVWGVSPSRIAASFSEHRIPHSSLLELALKSFWKGKGKITGKEHPYAPLVVEFLYPEIGAGVIPENILLKIKEKNGRIHLNSNVKKIYEGEGGVKRIVYFENGREREILCDGVISTIPVPELLGAIEPLPPQEVLSAASELKYRAIVFACLVVNRPSVIPAQSIYFTKKVFNRLSDMRKLGAVSASPPSKTLIIADIMCDKDDEIWNEKDEVICGKVIRDIEAEGFIRKEEVENSFTLRYEHGYPVYLKGYKENLDRIAGYFGKTDNFLISGRQGLFKYVDMDLALEMGFKCAEYFIRKKKKEAYENLSYEEKFFA
ncbi:MAG: FAD-dependent oxidoreductase, partial [bacterium]